MSTVNWTPKFKNANGDEVELILGVDQVANSDGTPLTEFIANMGESNDLTYTELVEDIDGEAPDVSPVVQNAIQDAIDGITAEQVGALPLTGGTLSGDVTTLRPIIFDRGNGAYGEGRIYKANASADSALCLSDTSSNGSQMVMYLNSAKQTFQVYCKTSDGGAYHDIYHEGNKPTASDVGASEKSKTLSLTIPASGWTGTEAPYKNTISVTGATANNNIEVIVPPTATADQINAYVSALILNGTQASGSITLNCWGTVPEIDLPVTVIVRGD